MRNLLIPLLPPSPESFTASLPLGGKAKLPYRDPIGLAHLVYGRFEQSELRYLCGSVSKGDFVIDVGAHIGYFTVPLALAVGPFGRVFAVEPEPHNLVMLQDNLALNNLHNVLVHPVAAAGQEGRAPLYLADESVYHTTAPSSEHLPITARHETGRTVMVATARLDTIWRESGSPPLAALKIDVEGTELDVLMGCREILQEYRPLLLIESDATHLPLVKNFLRAYNYSYRHPMGFSQSNHIFISSWPHM